MDVSDPQSVLEWVRQVLSAAGPPDLLLNNAALINASAPLWQVPLGEFSQVIDVNVKGIFHVMRAFPTGDDRGGTGADRQFQFRVGKFCRADVAPYCASKWAVEGLTRALAQELPKGLAAVPLNPGIIDTQMLRSCFGASAARFPTPEVWAAAAVPYLLQLSAADNGQPREVPR